MAKEDLDLKTAVYQAELEKYRSVPAEFATLSRNFANAQVQLDNSRLQLDSFIFTKNDVYGRLNASYKNLVDSIDPGEEPLTGEMIHRISEDRNRRTMASIRFVDLCGSCGSGFESGSIL